MSRIQRLYLGYGERSLDLDQLATTEHLSNLIAIDYHSKHPEHLSMVAVSFAQASFRHIFI